jgi:hypothetical protein
MKGDREMKRKKCLVKFVFVSLSFVLCIFFAAGIASAQEKKQDAILLTIFLKHDQTKTLAEINQHLDKTGFYKKLPPEGVEVVSWYVMMGIGQVVTLRVPPEKLRSVNLVIEQSAWGAFKTEFYSTYDFKPIWEAMPKK